MGGGQLLCASAAAIKVLVDLVITMDGVDNLQQTKITDNILNWSWGQCSPNFATDFCVSFKVFFSFN